MGRSRSDQAFDECLAPSETGRTRDSQGGFGESPARERLEKRRRRARHILGRKERRQFPIPDPTGEAFGATVQQGAGCGSQDQKTAGAAVHIDLGAEYRKNLRHQLNLIDTNKPSGVGFEIELGVEKLGSIAGTFEVKVDRVRVVFSYPLGEPRLTALPWAKQSNGRKESEVGPKIVAY